MHRWFVSSLYGSVFVIYAVHPLVWLFILAALVRSVFISVVLYFVMHVVRSFRLFRYLGRSFVL